MRDLHDCWLLANESHMSLVILDQAAEALRDEDMRARVGRLDTHTERRSTGF